MKALSLLLVAACTSSAQVPGPRFQNGLPVRVVDDRRDVAIPPTERDPLLTLYYFDGIFHRQVTRALELPRSRRALGVNAIDEVPDSTWFTNRIGIRDLALEEVRAGPVGSESPELHTPWTVLSSKVGGKSVGFVIRDARGYKFLLKFDPAGYPEVETATDVIVNRLLWAFGYNVAEDQIVHVKRGALILAPDATTKDSLGKKRRLSREEFDRKIATIEVGRDGAIRGLVSRMLDGKWLGGHPGEGVRSDDPNDRIAHELRRDLRGQYAVFAWVDHVDIKEHNTLDMWVADRDDPKRHYVKHYLIDFGKSLGFMATKNRDPRRGFSYVFDVGEIAGSFLSGGLWTRDWERRSVAGLRGVAAFDARSFDPAGWRATAPLYQPLQTADRYDKFWAAKILIRFTRAHIRAAVEAARLSDPRASEYLIDTLVARQRATARHWFAQVNPLDRFEVVPLGKGHALCFDDLAIEHRFASSLATTYRVARHERDGRQRASYVVRPGATSRTCPPVAVPDADDGYTIVRISTSRPGFAGSTIVHVARDPVSRQPRVIGVWRP